MGKNWEDPDGVEKISRAVAELVDDTARDAVTDFIKGGNGFIMISSSLNVHFGDFEADEEACLSEGEPLICLLEEAISSYEGDIAGAGPLPAMRQAYLDWKSGQLD